MAENVTPVTLEVKDFKAREVILVDYKFNQATDREGQISGIPGWMLAPTDPRDFTIKFQSTVDGKDMKQLKGTGCYCVKYKEYWADGEEHYEDIEIVCQKLENGPVVFENPWK